MNFSKTNRFVVGILDCGVIAALVRFQTKTLANVSSSIEFVLKELRGDINDYSSKY